MPTAIIQRQGESFPHNPATRGYHVVYRLHETNHCPGCARSSWIIGRALAECGFCGTAIPLSEVSTRGASGGHSRNRRETELEAWAA
ncbi:MAG TPA: hypothetical protein VGD19_12445 [Allosphingosinicella sp.]|jgi:hypothetical protein